jgi:hypothetical protein
MLSRELFEKLEIIARSLKENTLPFGGIQLILSGDFYQLRPVVKNVSSDEEVYCFASPLWDMCIDVSVFFSDNYRQKEIELQMILDDFRKCELSAFSHRFVKYLSRPLNCDPLDIVRLYSHRDDVCQANDACLELLPGDKRSFLSKDVGTAEDLKSCSAPKNLVVKVGARVVLLKNLSPTLVNGLRGTIKSYIDNFPCVLFYNGQVEVMREELFSVENEGVVVATRKQVPIDIAYAMTMHKSQGMSFEFLEVHLSKVFEAGQAYVAVSRSETIEGLRIKSCKENMPIVCTLVKEFYSKGIILAQELNVDAFLQNEKKRNIISLPAININTCTPVANTAKEPAAFEVGDEFVACELPDGAMDNIHRRVQRDSAMSEDISFILSKLNLVENSQNQFCCDSEFQIEIYCKWLWCIFEQMNHKLQNVPLIERKK